MALICQNCGHNEYVGAIFCSECGAKMIDDTGMATQSFEGFMRKNVEDQVVFDDITPLKEAGGKEKSLSIFLPDHDKAIPLSGKLKFTFGRVSMGQQILPDIDLAEYGAFENGVSRLHASIEISSPVIYITDLGSSNGTRINGVKLVPLRPHLVKHGDTVALGKLRFIVLMQS